MDHASKMAYADKQINAISLGLNRSMKNRYTLSLRGNKPLCYHITKHIRKCMHGRQRKGSKHIHEGHITHALCLHPPLSWCHKSFQCVALPQAPRIIFVTDAQTDSQITWCMNDRLMNSHSIMNNQRYTYETQRQLTCKCDCMDELSG